MKYKISKTDIKLSELRAEYQKQYYLSHKKELNKRAVVNKNKRRLKFGMLSEELLDKFILSAY